MEQQDWEVGQHYPHTGALQLQGQWGTPGVFYPTSDVQDDPEESGDKFCWKGHTDFAFTEDGIIVIHR